jgi:hypothetical protein
VKLRRKNDAISRKIREDVILGLGALASAALFAVVAALARTRLSMGIQAFWAAWSFTIAVGSFRCAWILHRTPGYIRYLYLIGAELGGDDDN